MNLSKLQKYILRQSLESQRVKTSRQAFDNFYQRVKKPPAVELRTNIITKSLERLIERGLLIGYGTKTQHKLFINQVKLTARGKKFARQSLGQQTSFPFKKLNK
ncbi:MAG: hypothetical protein WC465_01095 [Patescibacteria group bacterium]